MIAGMFPFALDLWEALYQVWICKLLSIQEHAYLKIWISSYFFFLTLFQFLKFMFSVREEAWIGKLLKSFLW